MNSTFCEFIVKEFEKKIQPGIFYFICIIL